MHAQDCISANAVDDCIRTVHHLDQFTTPELVASHERAIVRPYAHLCVSAAVAAELAGWGRIATVIPNGVDAARFASAVPDVRFGTYLLSVGGIEPRKGSLDLLEAYALLRPDLPQLKLVIAGGETLFDYWKYRSAWDARARDLGVSPVMLGPVDHDELPGLVAGAAAFAFPPPRRGSGWPRWRRWPPGCRSWSATCRCCARSSARPSDTAPARPPWPQLCTRRSRNRTPPAPRRAAGWPAHTPGRQPPSGTPTSTVATV